ncbi:MAG: hypothetical protein RIR70_973 [Pseudomonadota bacterium]|jgi:uncharacterized protein (DUF1800 family)
MVRIFCALLGLLAVFDAHAAPMGEDDARHLLARSGFTPTAAELAKWRALSRQDAVEQLLAQVRQEPVTAPPAEVKSYQPPQPRKDLTPEEIKARNQQRHEQERALRDWWVDEMFVTDSPLTERMTLFWHNHFASSTQKVHSPTLMYRQNALFRREALGSFARLLHAVSKDPAMVVYLDAASSKKEAPNENFAREVMELFTLGEGHYTEKDVKEAARAFTGWGFDRERGEFVFRPRLHDDGIKTVLGTSGPLDGDAVLNVLLAQRATAEFITTKLWREFVSPNPNKKEVERIAKRFRDNGYDIRVALRELFNSPAFWDPANRGTLVKSPVELVVGSVRLFGVAGSSAGPVINAAVHINQMGQALFAPPNVKGWPGGDAWIDSNTLLKRREYLTKLVGSPGAQSTRASTGLVNPVAWQRAVELAGLDAKWLVLGSGAAQTPSLDLAGWVADPHFQLK